MRALFIERRGDGGSAEPLLPTAISALARPRGEAAISARTGVATRPDGPFIPLATALVREHDVREAFADALSPPSHVRARRRRWLAWLALLPWLMWTELDREILVHVRGDVGPRVFMDLVTLYVLGRELVRPVVARPRILAVVSFAAGLRCVYFASESCGRGVHPAIWAAAILGGAMGFFFLAAPTPSRIALEILDRLGIAPHEARAAERVEPPRSAHVAAAISTAVILPVLLWLLRGTHPIVQLLSFFTFAAVVPELVRLAFGGRLALPIPSRVIPRALAAGLVGAALAAGLVNGSHWLSGTGAHLERCRDPAAYESSTTRHLLAREMSEARSGRGGTGRGQGAAIAVLLIPLAEERVYRGMLQRVLARRWGAGRGIAGGAILFGVAHLGVYQIALYQTVLLGVASGVAFSEGGIAAAVLAHALWNAHALF